MKKNLFLVLFFIFFLYGCGGGGGASSGIDSSTSVKTAYFYDSAVNGLEYNCGNKISGITGDAGSIGSFRYQDDCTVKFSIGKIYLGSINGSSLTPSQKIYPTTILGLPNTDDSGKNERLQNMLVLLQKLDSDNNLDNGIDINATVRNYFKTSINNIDFSLDSNNMTSLAPSLTNLSLIVKVINPLIDLSGGVEEALHHFENTLRTYVNPNINIIDPTPYLIDENGNLTTLTRIKTIHTKSKDIIIKGEANAKIYIYKVFAKDGNVSNPTSEDYDDTNITINSDRRGYLTLDFKEDDNVTHYHYFIKLVNPKDGKESNPLHLDILRDFTPPYIADTTIHYEVDEEQPLFYKINSKDNEYVKVHKLVNITEDSRSLNHDDFNITADGNITFGEIPNFDDNASSYRVIARIIDIVGNMTDIDLTVSLRNILDNPPQLIKSVHENNNPYVVNDKNISENSPSGVEVFVASKLLEQNLTIAPDNNSSLIPFGNSNPLSTITYKIEPSSNPYGWFKINSEDGNITTTNVKIDSEALGLNVNYIDLNISIENNNTVKLNGKDNNTTYVTIRVKIDNLVDTEPRLDPNTVPIEILENRAEYSSKYYIGTIKKDSTHKDSLLPMEFSIEGGTPDTNYFEIDSITGKLYVKPNPNFNYEDPSKQRYILKIKATNIQYDGNVTNNTFDVNQTINIKDVVDTAPKIKLDGNSSFVQIQESNTSKIMSVSPNGTYTDENTTKGYEITALTRDRVDIFNSDTKKMPFTINDKGEISANSNLLSNVLSNNGYIEKLDGNSTTNFTIQVKAYNYWLEDNETKHYSNPQSFDVNVSNVIDNAPKIYIPSSSLEFEENTTTNLYTTLYDVNDSGANYDENNITRFYFVGDTTQFDMNTTTGVIKLNSLFDYETKSDYNISVIASNTNWDGKENNSSVHTLTIKVTNKIESPPVISVPSTISIHENFDIDKTIAFIETSSIKLDEQDIKTNGIAISNETCPNKFKTSFDRSTDTDNQMYGRLLIKEKINYDQNQSCKLTIKASNDAGSSSEHNITINILDDVNKSVPLLVVGINFSDKNLTTYDNNTTDNYLENLVFGNNKNELQNYFKTVSKDKFYFQKANIETDTLANGVLVVDVNKTYDLGIGSDSKVLSTIALAMVELDKKFDFNGSLNIGTSNERKIDFNNDGNISREELLILFVVPGDTIKVVAGSIITASTNEELSDISTTLMDGKRFDFDVDHNMSNSYVVVPENNGTATIGSMAKYLSKALFDFPLPDVNHIYDYYDLMGDGYKGADKNTSVGQTPVHPSASKKISQGWITPDILKKKTSTSTDGNFVFYNTHDKNNFNVIKVPTTTPNKYYLLENRNQITDNSLITLPNYDNGFYAKENKDFDGGIVIWEVDENISTKFRQLVNKSNDTIVLPSDLNNTFEFYPIGSIDSVTKEYTIGVKAK